MDDTVRDRAQKNKARREAVLIEIAGARRQKEVPVSMLSASQLDAFTCALSMPGRLQLKHCGINRSRTKGIAL